VPCASVVDDNIIIAASALRADMHPQKSNHGQDDRIFYGVSSMQGWRISMEDAHACVLDLQPLEGDKELKPADSDVRISYFGVYDGHGGDKVALYTGDHLHKIIAKQDVFKSGNFEQALKDGFLAIDRAILSGSSTLLAPHDAVPGVQNC